MEVEGRHFAKCDPHTDITIYCKPCGDDTKHVPANGLCRDCEEHMCIACFGNHKKYKMCKEHVLLDINAKVAGACDNCDKREGDYEACGMHDCEVVKFYCPIHDQVGCGDCIILKHKTCDVKYIRDIASAFKDSKDRDDLVDKVQSCQREAKLCSKSIRITNVQVIDIHTGCISAIQSFRDEINEHIDKLERVSVQRADELKETDATRMSELEKECEDIANELSQMHKVLESQANDPKKLFVSAMKYKRGINALEQKLRNISIRNSISIYSFNRDENVKRAFSTSMQLGSVLHRTDASQCSDYSDLEYMDADDHYAVLLDYTLPVTGDRFTFKLFVLGLFVVCFLVCFCCCLLLFLEIVCCLLLLVGGVCLFVAVCCCCLLFIICCCMLVFVCLFACLFLLLFIVVLDSVCCLKFRSTCMW